MRNLRSIVLSAVAALAITATIVAPSFAMQPNPTTHLTDAAANYNPKVMVTAGVPTEDYGFLATTRYLEITTLKLEGVDNTTVRLDYMGVTRHVNLIPNGVAVVVDFGPINSSYAVDGGAHLLITYNTQRATSIITDVRAASAPVTN
jgi:hypothetical protein